MELGVAYLWSFVMPARTHSFRINQTMTAKLSHSSPCFTLRESRIVWSVVCPNTMTIPIMWNSPMLISPRLWIISSHSTRSFPAVAGIAQLIEVIIPKVIGVPVDDQSLFQHKLTNFHRPISPVVWFDWCTAPSPLKENIWASASHDIIQSSKKTPTSTTFLSVFWPNKLQIFRFCHFIWPLCFRYEVIVKFSFPIRNPGEVQTF